MVHMFAVSLAADVWRAEAGRGWRVLYASLGPLPLSKTWRRITWTQI